MKPARILFLLAAIVTLSACSAGPRFVATTPANVAPVEPGKVLFVVTAADTQLLDDNESRKTGYFLGEFYEPYSALIKAGYSVDIATPNGHVAPIDPESLKLKYWESEEERDHAVSAVQQDLMIQNPITLEEALSKQADYQAMLVPGGQGVMMDIIHDPTVHTILESFSKDDRPIGLVCHAPAVLGKMDNPGRLAGRKVTSVSGFEEFYIETFVIGNEAKERGVASNLEESGFNHVSAFPGTGHAQRDCNLVTSQNPFSSEDFVGHMMDALDTWRAGGRCTPQG